MNEKRKIEPRKIFVRYVPDQTKVDELKSFFSSCGNVEFISLVPPKNFGARSKLTSPYLFGFVMFATQQEADRAVGELNGKIFVNNKGLSGTIIVTHSRLMESRSTADNYSEGKSPSQDSKTSLENSVESKQEQERKELWQRYQANEEKLRQVHHDPAMEQELKDLKMKMGQLEVRKEKLEAKVHSLKEENDILGLQVKLKELDREQVKLKGAH